MKGSESRYRRLKYTHMKDNKYADCKWIGCNNVVQPVRIMKAECTWARKFSKSTSPAYHRV